MILLIFLAFMSPGKGEVAQQLECPEGWFELADDSFYCAKIWPPLKYVSWFHVQAECGVEGGYLPEVSDLNYQQLHLMLKSYNQLYGESMIYLGATDITYAGKWRWVTSKDELKDAANPDNWVSGIPDHEEENKDCLSQSTRTFKWRNVDCEDDHNSTQVAFMCMRKMSYPRCKQSKLVDRSLITCTASSVRPTEELYPTDRTGAPSCKTGWIDFQGSCYKYFAQNKNWAAAEANCNSYTATKTAETAHLVSVQSAEEKQKVKNLANSRFWTGGVAVGAGQGQSDWEWIDGSAFNWTGGWKSGEPSTTPASENCIVANPDGDWNDLGCTHSIPYVCEAIQRPAVEHSYGCENVFEGVTTCGVTGTGQNNWFPQTDTGSQGHWISLGFSKRVNITKLEILNPLSEDRGCKGVSLFFDRGVKVDAELKITGCEQWNEVSLAAPLETSTVKIGINSIHKLHEFQGFAEINVYGCYN